MWPQETLVQSAKADRGGAVSKKTSKKQGLREVKPEDVEGLVARGTAARGHGRLVSEDERGGYSHVIKIIGTISGVITFSVKESGCCKDHLFTDDFQFFSRYGSCLNKLKAYSQFRNATS